MPLPLYIEVTPLLTPTLTGIGRFTARLIEALARRRPLRLFALGDRAILRGMNLRTELGGGDEIVIDAPLPAADGDIDDWTTALLRRPQRRLDSDAARRSPCAYTLFRPQERRFAREISLLYDFTPFVLPECHEVGTRVLFTDFVLNALRFSDKAVAISASTKHDATWLSPLAPEDVVVAHPGPSLCDHSHAGAAVPARSPDLILVVSTREPRKNARFVLDWFLDAPSVPAGAELCWVGPRGWLWDSSVRGPRRGRVGRRFRFAGAVSDAALCELYRSAAFTIYPSLYEGFGFPVLDSLRHGAPVACSFNSSLKEFAGPGVFHFDPCDPASLEAAVRDLLAGPDSFDRPDLRERCCWQSSADAVLELCAG
jgi:glycosyltransferase involved in cell wall biosynthesis